MIKDSGIEEVEEEEKEKKVWSKAMWSVSTAPRCGR